MDTERIKKKFYELRRQKGLSWADLAARAGVSDYHNITNVLNSSGLTLATLEKLAGLVGVPPWELLKDETQQDEKPAGIACPYCGQIIHLSKTPPKD